MLLQIRSSSLELRSVPNRSELTLLRDVIIRHFHGRTSIDEVRDAVLDSGRSMKADGLTMEEILVVLKGAVTLAADHVTTASIPERAVALRAQMAPWLISLYMNESGGFGEPDED